MDSFIEEIKNEVRQDEYRKLWHKYKFYILTLIISLILFTVISVIIANYRLNKFQKETAILYDIHSSLNESGKTNSASFIKDRINQIDTDNIKAGAELKLAHFYIQEKNYAEGLSLLKKIADNKNNPDVLRDLARLNLLYSYLDIKNNSALNVDFVLDVEKNLNYLIDNDSAFVILASELKAFYLYNTGKEDRALEIFQKISQDKEAPISVRERADIILNKHNKKS